MEELKIINVTGREILDSRGNPTVEAEVLLSDGTKAYGAAPSGASTGKYEALELRDGDKTKYQGKSVEKAVHNINTVLAEIIMGMNPLKLYEVDKKLIEADGTKDKSNFGANAILPVSIAAARAAASAQKISLRGFLGGVYGNKVPVPMLNILNGGAHASNSVDIQEFMILPAGMNGFREGLRKSVEVYHALAKLLKEKGYSTAVGDEGGFAPDLSSEKEVLQYIIWAIELAGYKPGTDFKIAIDAAASEWKSAVKGEYLLPKSKQTYTTEALISHWKDLIEEYPICSIEDPLDEEDWEGWRRITEELGNKALLVGDDLFVTNTARLQKGIELKCGNSILIKMNQIGTVSETLEAIRLAQKAGYKVIISHRSGETEDTTIADLSVAVGADYIKTGAPCRTERVAKYNQLLRIEEGGISF